MRKALLIHFDIETGARPGGINPRVDQGLRCPSGWQNLDVTPAIEIRLVREDVDVSKYENIEGITVLEGEDAINEAVLTHIATTRYFVSDEALLLAHIKEKGISLDELAGKSNPEVAEYCYAKGLAGVSKTEIKLLEK